MQTLLNVTNANVCAIILVARSFLANTSGITTHESNSCGTNARASMRGIIEEGEEASLAAERRYKRVLYGEKLWRWSRRVMWWEKVC